MNRRDFFKVIAGTGLVPFLPKKAKSNILQEGKNLQATEVEFKWNSAGRALYRGYHLLAKGNRIKWSKIFASPEEAWRECDFVDLPDIGLDFARTGDLWACEDKLYCIGRFIWQITYTRNPDMPFEFDCVGETV